MNVQLPPLQPNKPKYAFYETQAQFGALIDRDDGRAVAEFLRSGAYERYTLLNGDERDAQYDLFYLVVRGQPPSHERRRTRTPSAQFRADAFQAFIDDGSVFAKPYGMLGILWRTWPYAHEFCIIIVSLIPAQTWRQMAEIVLLVANNSPERRFSVTNPELMTYICARWGRHANTLAQQIALDRAVAELRYISSSDARQDLNIWTSTEHEIEGMPATEAPLQQALRGWFRDARRRICYRDLTHFMMAVIDTHFPDEVLIQMASFALPCYDYTESDFDRTHAIGRSDVVGIITRVREAKLRAESEREARNVRAERR